MQIVSVSVEHFGRIQQAALQLGPGLNILFGPNDLGKSTLAQAIRFALLLQDSSSAHEPVVGWTSHLPPRVELVFKTEEQRFWRVTKSFDSSRGASLLEESRDGQSFVQLCKGRRVDEEIRNLLAWGIAVPGGRGGPRGLPESFLATTLLGRQGDVDAILMASIGDDQNDSGKQSITRALQALAQHPLFTRIFAKTQTKVDEAFTAGGQLKRGKNDPFPQAQRRVQEFQAEFESQQRKVDETRQVAERIRQLESKRLSKQAECDALANHLAELEKDLAGAQQLRQAQEHCAQLRDRLGHIDEVLGFVADLQARKAQAEAELERKLARLDDLARRLDLAGEASSAAREQWRDRSAGMTAQTTLARKNDLERQQIELDAQEKEASFALRQAHEAGEMEVKLAQLDCEIERKRKELGGLARRLSELQGVENQAAQDQKHIRALALYARRREAFSAWQKAQENDAAAHHLGAESAARIAEAERIEAELGMQKLPSDEQSDLLHRMQQELRVEEAKLGVGLSIEIRSHRPLSIEVARDGNPVEQHSFSEAAAFEADRELRMTIASVGELVVTGGARTTREKVRKLRARWKKEAALVLAAAGARDMQELEEMCRVASSQADKARAMRREAGGLVQQQKGLGNVAAALEESRQRLAECDQELAGVDQNQLAQRAALFGDHLGRETRKLEREAQEKLDAARAQREQGMLAIAEATPRVENLEKDRQRIQADLEKALSGMTGGIQGLVARAKQRLAMVHEKRTAIAERLRQEAQALAESLAAAEQHMREAEAAHAAARHACDSEAHDIDDLRQSLASLRGQLEERSRAAAAVDRPAAERALQQAQAALAVHPAPRSLPTEADLAKARGNLEMARLGLRELESELNKTQGALEQVGGHVAEEQLDLIKQALDQAEEQHRETDKEYRAWRLLLETLQKAENEQASHLGKTLVEPVASRFLALTKARYENVELGADLDTQGVTAAGGSRETKMLSVGTREQLATIFRLSLAERLQCSLLLDDQLVQSDPARMAWFSRLLRGAAASIQMIVLTCRPRDYLDEEEMPRDGGPVFLDNPNGPVRALDLGRIIVA